MRLVSAFALAIVLGLAPAPQAPPAQTASQFRGRVDLVRLEVTVLGADGRPAIGLPPGAFTVLENGVPQPIVAVDEVRLPSAAPIDPSTPAPPPPDVADNRPTSEARFVIIVLDDVGLPPVAAMMESGKAIAREVVAGLGPDDLAAVVHVAQSRLSQEPTRDRTRLLRSIDGFQSMLTQGGSAIGSIASTSRTLGMVMRAAAGVPVGRKMVVLVSVGKPITTEVLAKATFIDGLVGVGEADTDRDDFGLAASVTGEAALVDIPMFVFDPAGIGGMESYYYNRGKGGRGAFLAAGPLATAHRDYIRTMAERAGGFAVTSTNAPERRVAGVYVRTSHFYQVAYQPTDNRRDGRFRRVRVQVAGEGLRARARPGYFAPRAEETAGAASPTASGPGRAGPRASAAVALASSLPVSDLSLRLWTGAFPIPGRRNSAVAVVARLEHPAPARAERQSLTLLVKAFDSKLSEAATLEQTVSVSLRPLEGGTAVYEILGRIDLAPGSYRLRVAADHPVLGVAGSVLGDLDVPDLRRVAVWLAPLMWTSRNARVVGAASGATDVFPTAQPTSERTFGRDDEVHVVQRVYARGAAPEGVRLRVTDARGRVAFEHVASVEAGGFASGFADVAVPLPIGSFEPGRYVVTASIETSRPGRAEVRQVPFAMR